jgi:hypothetical protein
MHPMRNILLWKIVATTGGAGLTASAVWLNAEHIAAAEGWHSPLVLACIIVTLCAASAPPLAERAGKDGQLVKAAMLWVFFALAVAFSLSASIARSSDYVAGKIATAEAMNEKVALAKQALADDIRSRDDECKKRGPNCRKLEDRVDADRKALAMAAPVQSTDPGAERIAAVLRVDESAVRRYLPLLLPFALEIGGYVLLGLGLAPRRRVAADAEPVANATHATVERIMSVAIATAATPKRGSKAYYQARLQREFPQLAKQVARGEMSCYQACIKAGLRKAPVKRKWSADDYLAKEPA